MSFDNYMFILSRYKSKIDGTPNSFFKNLLNVENFLKSKTLNEIFTPSNFRGYLCLFC